MCIACVKQIWVTVFEKVGDMFMNAREGVRHRMCYATPPYFMSNVTFLFVPSCYSSDCCCQAMAVSPLYLVARKCHLVARKCHYKKLD